MGNCQISVFDDSHYELLKPDNTKVLLRRVTTVPDATSTEGLAAWREANGPDFCKRRLEFAGNVGKAVHRLISTNGEAALTDLSKPAADIAMVKYQHFLDFKASMGWKTQLEEKQVWSETLGVAGTMDALGDFDTPPPYVPYPDRPWLIDYKTGWVKYNAALQVAAYDYLHYLQSFEQASEGLQEAEEAFNVMQPAPSYLQNNLGLLELGEDGWRFLPIMEPIRYLRDFLLSVAKLKIRSEDGPFVTGKFKNGNYRTLKGL